MPNGLLVRAVGYQDTGAPIMKRSTAVLSDGTAVAIVADNNQSGVTGDGGDGTGNPKVYIYTSADRITWTLEETVNISLTGGRILGSATLDANNNVHLTWRNNLGAVMYCLVTYSAGPTYTAGSNETVMAAPANVNAIRRLDIDVLGTGTGAVVAAWYHDYATHISTVRMWCRETTGNTWVAQTNQTMMNVGSDPYTASEDISVSANRSVSANIGTVAVVAVRKAATGTDYGDVLLVYRINVATGAYQSSYVAGGSLGASGFNAGEGGGIRNYWVFTTGNNEYTVVGLVGTTNAKMWVNRFTTSGTTTIGGFSSLFASTNSMPRTNAINPATAICVNDDTVSIIDNGRVMTALISGVTSASLSSWFGTWDYKVPSGADPVLGPINQHYGGNNRNKDLGYGDVLTFYYANTSSYGVYHYYNRPAFAPANVLPAAGSTIATDAPTLSAAFKLRSDNPQARAKMRFQLASDSGFSTNLRDIVPANSAYVAPQGTVSGGATNGVQTHVLVGSELIVQGTWFVRAASIDEYGVQGAWSTAQSFVDSHPGSAIDLWPAGGVYFDYGSAGEVFFSWFFTNPSYNDYETAHQIIIENAATGVSVVDTGKVAYEPPVGELRSGDVVVIPSGSKDTQLRWQVRLWDRDDAVGPYSDYNTFFVGDKPTVTLTSPTEAETLATGNPTVTWTFSAGARVQSKYQVIITQGAEIIYDSTLLSGTATSHTVPVGKLLNNESYTVTVYVTDSVGLQNQDANTFFTSWTPPDDPNFNVSSSNYAAGGYLRVSWSNSTIDDDFIEYRVYRKTHDGDDEYVLIDTENFDQSSYIYDDYFAGSNVEYDYVVTQVADRFGSIVESETAPVSVTPFSEYYWLLHQTDNTKNIRLRNVTADSFSDEYETEAYNVIGRGRHVDYGDQLGYTGSLSLQLRDNTDSTAREQRLELEALKSDKTVVYLRSPFGDVFMVALGDLAFDRVPGMGTSEGVDVTVPYQKVGF